MGPPPCLVDEYRELDAQLALDPDDEEKREELEPWKAFLKARQQVTASEVLYVLEQDGWCMTIPGRVVTPGRNDVALRLEIGPRAFICSDTRESIDHRLAEAYYIPQPFMEYLSRAMAD